MTVQSIKCPNCGGGLKFNPELQKSKCEYCLSEFTIEELDKLIEGFQYEKAEQGHLMGYICNSCGAEVVTKETTSATFCYYCHNPVLLTERLTGEFKPTKIIPFSYDKDKAVASFLSWAKSKKFVPKGFYNDSQLEKITGIYIPYWMANVEANVNYTGKGINLRVWRAGNTEYTEHKEYRIDRRGTIDVNNIHELAMRKIDKALIDSISPYDESKAVDFSMSYLSGFFAEKYDIQKNEVSSGIEDRAKNYVSNLMQDSIGSYNRINMENTDMDLSIKGWNYTLLPAWILTYMYNGKTYIYAVNGQTGKSFGELPVDNKKLGAASSMIAAAVFAIAIAGGMIIW